jgi:hypothetical protein
LLNLLTRLKTMVTLKDGGAPLSSDGVQAPSAQISMSAAFVFPVLLEKLMLCRPALPMLSRGPEMGDSDNLVRQLPKRSTVIAIVIHPE